MKWMNRFLYYNFDRFSCVRIPTQIEIKITIQIWTALRIHVHFFVYTLWVKVNHVIFTWLHGHFCSYQPNEIKWQVNSYKILKTMDIRLFLHAGRTRCQNKCSFWWWAPFCLIFAEKFIFRKTVLRTILCKNRSCWIMKTAKPHCWRLNDATSARRACQGGCTGQHQVRACVHMYHVPAHHSPCINTYVHAYHAPE